MIRNTPGYLITVEENVLMGIWQRRPRSLSQWRLIGRIGLPDVFIEHGPVSVLHEKYGLTPEAISAYAQG